MRRSDLWMLWFTTGVAVLLAFGSITWLLSMNDRLTTTSFADRLKIVVALPAVAGIASAEQLQRAGLPEEFGLLVGLVVAFAGPFLATLAVARWSRR